MRRCNLARSAGYFKLLGPVPVLSQPKAPMGITGAGPPDACLSCRCTTSPDQGQKWDCSPQESTGVSPRSSVYADVACPSPWVPSVSPAQGVSEYKHRTLPLTRICWEANGVPIGCPAYTRHRGKAIYPERLGQAQVCFQIAPFFLRALVRLLAQGTRHLEAHLHAKHKTHRVAAPGCLLPAQRMDADRLLATRLTILDLLLWVPATPLWDLRLSLVTRGCPIGKGQGCPLSQVNWLLER